MPLNTTPRHKIPHLPTDRPRPRAWGAWAWRGAGAWRGPGVWGGGWSLGGRTFACSFVRSLARTDGNYPPLFYRTTSPLGPLPKKDCQEFHEICVCLMMESFQSHLHEDSFSPWRDSSRTDWQLRTRPTTALHVHLAGMDQLQSQSPHLYCLQRRIPKGFCPNYHMPVVQEMVRDSETQTSLVNANGVSNGK